MQKSHFGKYRIPNSKSDLRSKLLVELADIADLCHQHMKGLMGLIKRPWSLFSYVGRLFMKALWECCAAHYVSNRTYCLLLNSWWECSTSSVAAFLSPMLRCDAIQMSGHVARERITKNNNLDGMKPNIQLCWGPVSTKQLGYFCCFAIKNSWNTLMRAMSLS